MRFKDYQSGEVYEIQRMSNGKIALWRFTSSEAYRGDNAKGTRVQTFKNERRAVDYCTKKGLTPLY